MECAPQKAMICFRFVRGGSEASQTRLAMTCDDTSQTSDDSAGAKANLDRLSRPAAVVTRRPSGVRVCVGYLPRSGLRKAAGGLRPPGLALGSCWLPARLTGTSTPPRTEICLEGHRRHSLCASLANHLAPAPPMPPQRNASMLSVGVASHACSRNATTRCSVG
eukprot:4582533-Amphidinium_carterae.1